MRLYLPAVCMFIWAVGFGQAPPKQSLFDSLFTAKQVDLVITYPFDSLYKTQREEIEASLTLLVKGNVWLQNEPILLNLRGKFRRINCTMPPLMLNFRKSKLRDMGLKDTDEIKLVTHCIEGTDGIDNLTEELLCYQLYSSLTEFAYRALWVNVTYCDQQRLRPCFQSNGLLLEPDKVMEDRLHLKEKRIYNIGQDSLDYDSYARIAAFNWMIGNRDWSVRAGRNAKLFQDKKTGQYLVIPYDFDYANIVGAGYRKEFFLPGMHHPFDRVFEGDYFIERAGEMALAFLPFEAKLESIVDQAENPIPQKRRQKINQYLRNWFKFVSGRKPDKLPFGTICHYKNEL